MAANAPPGVRPRRVVACTSLSGLGPDPVCDGIGIEWFGDVAHLGRFEEWLASPGGAPLTLQLEDATQVEASPLLVADEHVVRGEAWLDQRWRQGGQKLKHMAIATRAAGLSVAEFSERWRARAGTMGTATGGVVSIPERARGRAYVQNHPRPDAPAGGYDALNEVYFDDLDSLRFRIEWFGQNLRQETEADLVSRSWFVAAREELVWAE
jgi:hypothetical protein